MGSPPFAGFPGACATENFAIAWGLPLSVSWKSSCRRLRTTFPWASRTTTRTSTRLTFTLKVVEVSSREDISGVFALVAGGAAGGLDDDDCGVVELLVAGLDCAAGAGVVVC